MIDFMLDLETLDNNPTAAVVQIGCVCFVRETGEVKGEFIRNVDLASEMDDGFTVNADTIQWWMGQAALGNDTWSDRGGVPGAEALQNLNAFILDYKTKSSLMWSHSTFDAPIMTYHYNKLGVKQPFRYNQWVDLRTISLMAKGLLTVPKSVKPKEGTHDALVDCRYQVAWFVQCYNAIKAKDSG